MIQRVGIAMLAALLLWLPQRAGADDFKPAYLQLTQTGAETYEVMWKLPALDESTALKLAPHFPDGTRELTVPRVVFANNMAIKRWRIGVPQGLNGKSIRISGLVEARTDAIVRVVRQDGSEQVGRILPGSTAFTVEASPGGFEVARTYTGIGIGHILLGFDHLLFVLALVMGDFVTVGVMGGQQIASVGKTIQVQTSYLQFPLAAANAVILLAVVLMIIWGLTRIVDIRKEL